MLNTALTNPVVSRLMLVTFLAGCAFNGIEFVFGLWTQARFDWGPQEVGGAFAVTGSRRGDLPDRHHRTALQALRRGARAGGRHGADDALRVAAALFGRAAG